MVYTHLIYGVEAWACARKELIHKVEVAKKNGLYGSSALATTWNTLLLFLLGCTY